MEISILIERGFGIAYALTGFSLMISTKKWQKTFESLFESANSFSLGFLSLYIGAFMVAGHNIWEPSPRVLTTIIAWAALVKGVVYLSFPDHLKKLAVSFTKNTCALRAAGAFVVAVGSFIAWYSCDCVK